jgi:hypothetical protein
MQVLAEEISSPLNVKQDRGIAGLTLISKTFAAYAILYKFGKVTSQTKSQLDHLL